MAERYTRLLSLEKPKWNSNSPVILEKGALLRDHVANANLLQFQFRNIGANIIKAISITVDCFDAMSQTTLEKTEFNYLDLNAKSNDVFGSNVPIVLQKDDTRDFSVFIKKIMFADGTAKELDLELKNIESPKSIDELGELTFQFETEVKTLNPSMKCVTLPQKHEDYWYCACGAFNRSEDKECRICGSHFDKLIELTDLDYLTSQQQQAKAREDERQQQAKEREEERRRQASKKTRKYGIITAIVLVAIIAISSFVKLAFLENNEREIFNSAEASYNNAEYLLAYSLYAQLPDNKKAQEKIASIKIPLEGYWIREDGSDSPLYYFNDNNLFCNLGWNKEQIGSGDILWSTCYPFETLSVGVDGTISIPIVSGKVDTSWNIKVLSNDKITVKAQSNPDAFNLIRIGK